MDFLFTLQQFINMEATISAVIVTQFVKYLLPSPTLDRTAEVIPGHLTTRLLPFFPLLVGIVVCYFLESDGTYTLHDGMKGAFSGAFAAYVNRTTKVTIFGE